MAALCFGTYLLHRIPPPETRLACLSSVAPEVFLLAPSEDGKDPNYTVLYLYYYPNGADDLVAEVRDQALSAGFNFDSGDRYTFVKTKSRVIMILKGSVSLPELDKMNDHGYSILIIEDHPPSPIWHFRDR
ncbi:MAG: hypothetical protein JNJ45_09565 [Chthonomonas sp.]|nr:hypothetical protein [Chthonomonas sp.]